MNTFNKNYILLIPFLIFLCAIPFGEISLSASYKWLTITKASFFLLVFYLGFAFLRGWRTRIYPIPTLFLLLFVVASLLASCLSIAPKASFMSFLRLAALALLCLITIRMAAENNALTIILRTLLVIGSFLSILGIYQTLTGKTIFNLGIYDYFGRMIALATPGQENSTAVIRASATFDHPNLFGAFLIASLPYAIATASRPGQKRTIIALLYLAIPCCIIALVYTFSRSAWLGAASALAVLVFWRSTRITVLAAAVASLLVAIILLAPEGRAAFWNRSGTPQEYDSGRLYSYHTACRMISEHPLTGVGPGMFDTVYKEYSNPDEKYRQNPLHKMDAHNTLLDVGSENGLLALFPFVLILGYAGISLLRKVGFPQSKSDLSVTAQYSTNIALLAGLTGITVQSLFHSLEYEEIYWILIGACIAASQNIQSSNSTECKIPGSDR